METKGNSTPDSATIKLNPHELTVLKHLRYSNGHRHYFQNDYFFHGHDLPGGVFHVKMSAMRRLFNVGYITEKSVRRYDVNLLLTSAGRAALKAVAS